MRHALTVLLLAAMAGLLSAPKALAQDVERGKAVYDSRCVICHGDQGDGKGLVGIVHRAQTNGLVTAIYPRDFTAGVYKFRSTPTGVLPTDEDLMRTVTDGISRSGMPSHTDLSEADRGHVIAFIKTFSPRWEQDAQGEPIPISMPPYVGTPESTERGAAMYEKMQCHQCHGAQGTGDGPAAATLQDSWGDKIVAFDFTSGPLKAGSSPEVIYRTFITGLDGTPMPSYEEAMPEEQDRWDLVSFCLDLMDSQAGQ